MQTVGFWRETMIVEGTLAGNSVEGTTILVLASDYPARESTV